MDVNGSLSEGNFNSEYGKKGFKVYLILFLMVLLYMLVKHYSFYASDPYEYVPSIMKFLDTNYLNNDWFLNTQTDFNARTYFFYFIYIFHWILSIKSTFLVLFIINTFFLVLGVFSISEFLFKNRFSAYLASFLVLFSVWKLIGDFAIIAPFFTPSQISITLSIWALYFFIRKRYNIMFLLLGLSTFLHLLIGLAATILLSTVLVIKYRFESIKKFLVGALFYLPPALLTVIPLGLIELSQKTNAKEVIMSFALIRIPWHIIPSQFSILSYISFSVLLVLFFFSLRYTSKSEKHKDILAILLCAVIYFFLGYVFVEVIPVELVVKLQFFRMIILFRTIMLIYIANYFSRKIFSSSNKVFTLVAFASLFDHILIAVIPLYLLYGVYIHKKLFKLSIFKSKRIDILSFLLLIFLVLFFVIFFFFRGRFLSQTIFFRIIHDFLWIFLVLSLYSLFYLPTKSNVVKIPKIVLSLLVIFLCLSSFYFVNKIQTAEPEKDDMYAWIKSNTPEESVFIIPPYLEDFRIKANRAIVIDFKSMPFKSDQMVEWKNRLEDVTNHIEFKSAVKRKQELKHGYDSLTEQDFINLKNKYNFDYILVEKPKKLNFTVLHGNDKYTLYRVY